MDIFVQAFDHYIGFLSNKLGKAEDQGRILLLMLLAYPIGFMLHFIKGTYLRHAYSIIIGGAMQYLMFREGCIHFLVIIVGTYFIISVLERTYAAYATFTFCLGYLSVCHINRVLYDYGNWSLDATTYIMPLVAKLSTIGYCIMDGSKDDSKLTDYQKNKKLTKIPQLYEILSYSTFPCANMCGPFFEFRDYKYFIEHGVQATRADCLMAASYDLMIGFVVVILCIFIPANFTVDILVDPTFYDNSFFYISAYYWIA